MYIRTYACNKTMKCLECVLVSAHILTLTKILKKALPCF